MNKDNQLCGRLVAENKNGVPQQPKYFPFWSSLSECTFVCVCVLLMGKRAGCLLVQL